MPLGRSGGSRPPPCCGSHGKWFSTSWGPCRGSKSTPHAFFSLGSPVGECTFLLPPSWCNFQPPYYVLLYCLEGYSFVTRIIMCTARIGRREIQGRYDNILKGGKFLNFEVGKGRFQKIKLMKKFWGDRIKQRLI